MALAIRCHLMALPLSPLLAVSPLVELASGVDALYLSGKSQLPPELVDRLEAERDDAAQLGGAIDFELGGMTWRLAAHGRQKYRFVLSSDLGWFGLTASTTLPTVWVQPKAILLHALGPADAALAFTAPIEAVLGPIPWKVSRVDLQSDWQGMALHRDLSENFLGRANARNIYEGGDLCTGFTFGAGKGGGTFGRIYNKTVEIEAKGGDYWFDIWGERFDPAQPVHRVEFQWGRGSLRTMGLTSPADVLDAVGDLWRYSTAEWLTLRTKTADKTKSRWPIAPEWTSIQRSALSHKMLGIARLKDRDRKGALRLLMPFLTGCVSSAAVHLGTTDIADTLAALDLPLRDYQRVSGMPFASRVDNKRRTWGAT